jgi:hypothetical protein
MSISIEQFSVQSDGIRVGDALLCVGDWVTVETDYSQAKSGFASTVSRRHRSFGIVTYIAEDFSGIEMTTGATSAFKLKEILLKWAVSIKKEAVAGGPGRHREGLAEAESRAKDADRKKVSREKREGLFR